jgi:prepilin-type N-terminal cleavage/methylation domain-containing protein
MTSSATRLTRRRAGFTLIELLVSLTLGLIILTVSTNFATSTLRASRGSDLRDGLNRDARFVGLALSRDLQDAGIAFESNQQFGSIATRNDTVVALSVPFMPNEAEAYDMVVPADTASILPPGGTCGATCIDVVNPNVVPFQLAVGDLALLQVQNERRLIVLTAVTAPSPTVRRLTFADRDTLFVFPGAFAGGLRLTRNGVAVQRLSMTGWFRDPSGTVLMRADGFKADGTMRASVAARGVDSFSARLNFTDGDELTEANGIDADTTNDYNRITSVVVRSRLRVERADRSVNGGAPLFRDYEWRVAPRNLLFERNRIL